MAKSILVVDDVVGVRRELMYLLEDEGYTVFQAENGRKAQYVLQQETVDLVISDILMPDMDGIELSLYMNEFFPDTKTIIISGGGTLVGKTSAGVDSLLEDSRYITKADAVFKKPFKSQDLIDSVADLLSV